MEEMMRKKRKTIDIFFKKNDVFFLHFLRPFGYLKTRYPKNIPMELKFPELYC